MDMPLYEVIDFKFSVEDTDSKLVVRCNGKHIIILLDQDNFSESPVLKDKYLFFLRVADEFELEGYTVEDFYDWVVEPFLPLLEAIPPLNKDSAPTLQQFLFPETTLYTLKVVGGELSAALYEADEGEDDWVLYGVSLEDQLSSSWQSFRPSEIEICPEHPGEEALSSTPRKVQLAGGASVFFLKLVHVGDTRRTEAELRNYAKIRDARLEDELRIPRLHGLVQDESGLVYGLLFTYVDCGNETLTCVADPDSPVSLRRKWADQVKSTVERFHDAGVTWGDVKTDNVLVDLNNDAWVINFGGGYTEGWVDKEFAGTAEGDLQGLAKIFEFVGV